MHGHLRVVGAGLHAEVAAAARRVEVVAGKRGRSAERRRPRVARGRTGRRRLGSKSVGPKPTVSVSRRRRQAQRLAGVVGRCLVVGRRPPPGPTVAARRSSRAAASVHSRSSATSSSRESVVTSNAAKCSRSWTGVTMPAWCAPWNASARAPSPGPRQASSARRALDEREPTPSAGARPRPIRRRRPRAGGGAEIAGPVIAARPRRRAGDSGSASALTASASSLTCRVGSTLVVADEAVAAGGAGRAAPAGRGELRVERRARGPRRARRARTDLVVGDPARRRRWPGSPRGRCATRSPPRR